MPAGPWSGRDMTTGDPAGPPIAPTCSATDIDAGAADGAAADELDRLVE